MANPAGPGQDDPRSLHDVAVDAQTDLQKLATGLAHAGAAPQAVAQLTKMATIMSDVVKVLAAGAVGQQGQAPAGGAQTGPPAAPAQVAPPAQAQASPPGAGGPPEQVHQSIQAATHNLHAAMIASKQQRQAQGQA